MKSQTRIRASLALLMLTAASLAPAATLTVTDGGNSGAGTLRDAITTANLDAAADTIEFAAGVTAVTLTAALPTINQPLTIDGTVNHSAGTYVELNGGGLTGYGFEFNAASCAVYGMYIHNFTNHGIHATSLGTGAMIGAAGKGNVIGATSHGIYLDGANGVIKGNIIGLNTAGTATEGNAAGITVGIGPATIGGSTAGERNVISGSVTGNGINALGNDVVIYGNYIGTDVTGMVDLGNAAHGVYSQGLRTIIGGTGAGEGNLISGNNAKGIQNFSGDDMKVIGNVIGLGSDGVTDLGNTDNGVYLTSGADNGEIRSNVVSGNNGWGVRVALSTGVTVTSNIVGLGTAGTTSVGNTSGGIFIESTSASPTITGNTVSGNGSNGIAVSGTGGTVKGNVVGLATDGVTIRANTGSGISVGSTASAIVVGGTGVGEANTISGNGANGIDIAGGDSCSVVGNVIGLSVAGTAAAGNTSRGIYAYNASDSLTITGNTISSNGSYGMRIESSQLTAIAGNRVGTDVSGNTGFGNLDHGISIVTSVAGPSLAATIGGTNVADKNYVLGNSGYGVEMNATAPSLIVGNHIAGNTNSGIRLVGAGAATVQGNIIGINVAGTAASPNAGGGITAAGSGAHLIGGSTAAERNIVSGNTGTGISVSSTATGVTVRGNYVGTDAAGTAAIPNTSGGISTSSTTGSGVVVDANVSSGNTGVGILVDSPSATVSGNYCGVTAAGTSALGNSTFGIRLNSNSDNSTVSGNVSSGNTTGGIVVDTGGDGVIIKSNIVGLDATMTTAISNGTNPKIWCFGSNLMIGGPNASDANIVAGNTGVGILTNGTNNTIQGNLVGSNPSGAAGLGNTSHGIQVNGGSSGTQVLGNTVVANGGQGIRLNQTGIVIKGNYIGTDSTGTWVLGNGQEGMGCNQGGHTIGGTGVGDGNVIANGASSGVRVTATSTAVAILGNSIYNNGLTGIALGSAPVLVSNDALDADTGGNNQQNFPVIGPVTTNATSLAGSLSSAASASFTVAIYSSPSADATGYGEGRTFLGTTTATTDASGNATWSFTLPSAAGNGTYYTATAMDSLNNTSMFSRSVPVEGAPQPAVDGIVRAAGEPTTLTINSPGKFTVTFTEPIAGADLSDFAAREVTTTGAAVTAVASPFGKHATFNGTTDGFSVPVASAVNLANSSFTVEFWASRARSATAETILSLGDSATANNQLKIGFTAADLPSVDFTSNALTAGVGFALTNEWHHWAVSYDAATNARKIYLDGTEIASGTASADFAGTGALGISNPAIAAFSGSLDDLRIWNTTRTASEIANNRFAPLAGNEAGLVAYYAFDAVADLAVNADGADDVADASTNSGDADGLGAPTLTASGVYTEKVEVTITSGTGSGTVGLNVLDDNTIVDVNGFDLSAPESTGETFNVFDNTAVRDWTLLND